MEFSTLINEINSVREQISAQHGRFQDFSHGDPDVSMQRSLRRLLTAAQEMVSTLEVPEHTLLKIAKAPVGQAALRTAIMMGIFENFGVDEVKSADEIALLTGADRILIVRIMRVLVGIGVFLEDQESLYTHSVLSQKLLDPTFRTLIAGMSSTASAFIPRLPEYLVSRGFQNPDDPQDSLFHYALGTKLNMFEWLSTQPELQAEFGLYQAAATRIQGPKLFTTISSLFPSQNELLSPSEKGRTLLKERILLVDIGAGHGQALGEIRRGRKDLIGRMVAQDLDEVIRGREPVEGVETMTYNFLTPQPLKGASVYFFCHIFHNWPDSTCRQILANTIPALVPDRSRIVIVDNVVPSVRATAFTGLMDLSMMTFGGMERSEGQWRALLEDVGLRVTRIEEAEPGSLSGDGVVEAVLKESNVLPSSLTPEARTVKKDAISY